MCLIVIGLTYLCLLFLHCRDLTSLWEQKISLNKEWALWRENHRNRENFRLKAWNLELVQFEGTKMSSQEEMKTLKFELNSMSSWRQSSSPCKMKEQISGLAVCVCVCVFKVLYYRWRSLVKLLSYSTHTLTQVFRWHEPGGLWVITGQDVYCRKECEQCGKAHTNSRFDVLCCSSLHTSVLLWGPVVVSTPFLFHVLDWTYETFAPNMTSWDFLPHQEQIVIH